jgi:uncharacterized protein (DUF362 family)/Pyruvate/2-oxoacid:ferredoxin oxidoreductase delta subunit
MRSVVHAVRCDSYQDASHKVAELLEMCGGIESFVRAGESIALKPNLLRPAEPELAISTHPSVVRAVARLVKEAGAIPSIVESPGTGNPHKKRLLERLFRTCGITEVAESLGIEVSLDVDFEEVSFEEGKLVKRFEILKAIVEADGVISLPKMKTHSYTRMTGAVKNCFGTIHGLHKTGYHAKLQDTSRFTQMLLDLAACVNPRLSVVDAVVAMEGDGPNLGSPRQVGLLLASSNLLALDVVAGEIMRIPASDNPLLIEAKKRGLTPHCLDQVELAGVSKESLRIDDFELPPIMYDGAGYGAVPFLMRPILPLLKPALTVKPRVIPDECSFCGSCKKACPMDAIEEQRKRDSKFMRVDDDRCIRCYCCHEMCPSEAIVLHRSMLHRLCSWLEA